MDSHWVDFVVGLIQQTHEGKLIWKRQRMLPAISDGRDGLFGDLYVAMRNGRQIGIYEVRLDDDYREQFDRLVWRIKHELVFLDTSDRVVYEIPYNVAISDLYRAVEFQANGVEEYYKEFSA